jgi:hypothetical protein
VLVPIAVGRQELIRATDDDGHLHVFRAADGIEVGEIASVAADEADRFQRLLWQAAHRRGNPLRQPFGAALDGQSVTEVVRENNMEAASNSSWM